MGLEVSDPEFFFFLVPSILVYARFTPLSGATSENEPFITCIAGCCSGTWALSNAHGLPALVRPMSAVSDNRRAKCNKFHKNESSYSKINSFNTNDRIMLKLICHYLLIFRSYCVSLIIIIGLGSRGVAV